RVPRRPGHDLGAPRRAQAPAPQPRVLQRAAALARAARADVDDRRARGRGDLGATGRVDGAARRAAARLRRAHGAARGDRALGPGRHRARAPAQASPLPGRARRRAGPAGGGGRIAPGLAWCDREGVPAYLETAKERNVVFYERHGFRVTEERRLPRGPKVWLMWREAR